jgi:hypothetical protein
MPGHPPLQQRAPDDHAHAAGGAEDEHRGGNGPEAVQDADGGERQAARTPADHHHREVAAGEFQGRCHQRPDCPAHAHHGEQEAEHPGIAAELVTDHKRHQHFDGANQEQHRNAGPQQRPEQPRRADGVADALPEVVEERRPGRAFVGIGAGGVGAAVLCAAGRCREGMTAQEVQDDERKQVAAGHARHGMGRGERGNKDARDSRSGSLLEDGPHGALHAVGRQQVLGRQDPRQDGGVGREEERGPHAQDKAAHGKMPQLQPTGHRQPADGSDHGQVGAFDGDDQQPLRNPVRGDPAGQDEGHQAHAACCRYERKFQRPAAEMDHLVDHGHSPHAGSKDGNGQGCDKDPVLAVRKRPQGLECGHRASLGGAG